MRLKISESAWNILCLQETKRDSFDNAYIKKFCPRHLNCFAFHPSAGASSGLLTVWNGNLYNGDIIQANSYAITIKLTSNLDNSILHISNVYGPAHSSGKTAFITWLLNFNITTFDEWMLAGDFNLYRSIEDRNRQGDEVSEMQMFNNAINDLDLIEVTFSGRRFTWSNMQLNPLLVKLDWVFVSSSWGLSYPTTSVQPLAKPISNHIPYVINIGSKVPRSNHFRFENFLLDQSDFL